MTAAVAAPAQDACRAAKVTASAPAPFDSLGIAVAVSGSTALAGAQWQDDNGADSGAAYVYSFDGTTWVQTQVLLASDGHADDLFGRALAMDDSTLVVGAPGHVHDARSGSGSAYVFRREGTLWVPEQELLASDGAFQDGFGASVAVSGNVVLIGALFDGDNGGSGSAYVFRFDPGTSQWLQQQKLLPSDGANGDFFGVSVAIGGEVAVIGADGQDPVCSGGVASKAGAAYVFRFHPESSHWAQEQKLVAPDCAAGDNFGHAVSISADVILVGAMHDDDNGPNSGSAYVLRHDPRVGAWMDEQKLLASDGHSTDDFGRSVSLDNQSAIVGAPFADEAGLDLGAAYVFHLTEPGWLEQQKLLPDPGPWTAFFGWSLATSGDAAMAGAYGESVQSGSAYLYSGLLGLDCNGNGSADSCDIIKGASSDANGDGVPDECQGACPWDLNSDSAVGIVDFLDLLSLWGSAPGGPPDFDGGGVGVTDFLLLLANWGPCP